MALVSYDEALQRFRSLVFKYDDVTVKGKANPYTSINGNMFSFLDKAGVLCLRLSKADLAAFVKKYKTDPVEQYGAVMKEYVAVPERVAADPAAIGTYFEKCKKYVESLPEKATKK